MTELPLELRRKSDRMTLIRNEFSDKIMIVVTHDKELINLCDRAYDFEEILHKQKRWSLQGRRQFYGRLKEEREVREQKRKETYQKEFYDCLKISKKLYPSAYSLSCVWE